MRLKVVVCLLLLNFVSYAVANAPLTDEQVRDGWIALFDGETLFGWQATSDADWSAEGGEVRVSGGERGFLMTTSRFGDYTLHAEFKAPPTTNSGLFLRTPLNPSNPAEDCYEINIAPVDNPFPTGSIVGRSKIEPMESDSGWTVGSRTEALHAWNGEWHTYEVTLRGGQVVVMLDGTQILELQDSEPLPRGHIGLQFREGEIAFRNIRLKPLGGESLFNGKDLEGWNTDRADASRFEVTPAGELRVLDGRGQLESEARYGDFLLQLECRVDGDALNSGLFFRCIPRDFMMGYEAQIHNGMIDGDPTQPVDCGTGGIFRRQDARRIVARDREWFGMTISADGPHLACWVNGFQVSDWTDNRKEDANPRRGLRTKPGTLAIQGHDPTTDLLFRNLRIISLDQ